MTVTMGWRKVLVGKDHRAVLVAHIGSLTVELGGVVEAPERIEELAIGDPRWVVLHLHHLGVARTVRTDLAVSGVVSVAPGIADRGVGHSFDPPKRRFHSPEAPCPECRNRHATALPMAQRSAMAVCSNPTRLRLRLRARARACAPGRRYRIPRGRFSARFPRGCQARRHDVTRGLAAAVKHRRQRVAHSLLLRMRPELTPLPPAV